MYTLIVSVLQEKWKTGSVTLVVTLVLRNIEARHSI